MEPHLFEAHLSPFLPIAEQLDMLAFLSSEKELYIGSEGFVMSDILGP
jgi:hypothetical protein